jgi:hypothetical protein
LALAPPVEAAKLPLMKRASTLVAKTPADLIDAIPFLLGFHPSDSLVVIGLDGDLVVFAARYDLPPPTARENIAHLAAIVARQGLGDVTLVGYGPVATVDPVIALAIGTFDAFRLRVHDAIRVHSDRWWSYFCNRIRCCPPEGNPCNPVDSVIAAEATYRGQVALPSRAALVARVAPVGGEEREAMTAATTRARERLQQLLIDSSHQRRAVRRAGRMAIREAEKRHRSGNTLTDDEVAWLGVLLIDGDVSDYALDRATDGQEWRSALWSDVLRRVDPGYATKVACLLSFAAWRDGQGALARVAIDRALAAEPLHPFAVMLDEVLGMGIGPQAMTALDSLDRGSVARLMAAGGAPNGRQPFVEGGAQGRAPARPPRNGGPGSMPKPRRPKSGDSSPTGRSRRMRRRSE